MHAHDNALMRLLPEWAEQSAVLLIWPDEQTDWKPYLAEIRQVYAEMVESIARHEQVLLVARDPAAAREWLAGRVSGAAMEAVRLVQAEYDDTWARDTAPLTLSDGHGGLRLVNFRFNGWGDKFSARRDNALNGSLHGQGVFACPMTDADDFVLEGGSLEIGDEGILFTTSPCLLAPHRNQPLTQTDLQRRLCAELGVSEVCWIGHGYLEGDDTDGHIDTLVRCAPGRTLVYVGSGGEDGNQGRELRAMEEDLHAISQRASAPYRLLRLPMPSPIYDDGERLPATYANFLVINGAVLVPTYGQPDNDAEALRVVGEAFPGREIVGIDARTVIRQHGSLHCLTMQMPKGTCQGMA